MYYDLFVPWAASVPAVDLQKTLLFLKELGYSSVALTHTLSGKLPADLTCPIPKSFDIPGLAVLRRCNLILSDTTQNSRLQTLANNYDILSIRPTSEKTLQQASLSLDCDVISIDLSQRQDSHFRMKMLASAIERGIKLEICYAPAVGSADATARRNLIGNASQLIRATRGRGIIISSEAKAGALSCRAPHDVINLAAVWGLGAERGQEALTKLPRAVVVAAKIKQTSFRGVIDVIDAGTKPDIPKTGKKRKADDTRANDEDGPLKAQAELVATKVSKRAAKRARQANLQNETEKQA